MSPFALSQARLPGTDDGLGPISNLQLGEDVRDVVANSLSAERQLPGDGGVGVSLRDEVQYLALALGERWKDLGRRRVWRREVGEHPFCDRRTEDSFSLAHCLDREHHLLLVGVLQDVPARPSLQGHKHRVIVLEERYNQDADVRALLQDPSRGLYAVDVGHLQVHQNHVRLHLRGARYGLLARRRLTDDLELGYRRQK